jgi:hypothetical protein
MVRYQVLTFANTEMSISWVVAKCSLVDCQTTTLQGTTTQKLAIFLIVTLSLRKLTEWRKNLSVTTRSAGCFYRTQDMSCDSL